MDIKVAFFDVDGTIVDNHSKKNQSSDMELVPASAVEAIRLLKENGIDNDVVVVAVNENNTFNVLFRVNDKDKDKAREILKDNKDKNIDEILKTHRGGKREPLEAQIKRAKKEKGDRAIEGMLESMSKVLKKKSKEVDR